MIWDIIVIATLIVSAIIAFFRGFVREVLTIVGVVGGVLGSYYGGPSAIPAFRSLLGVSEDAKEEDAEKLFDIIPYELIADGLAYGTIFLVIVIFLSVVSHFLAAATKKSGLGIVDRSMGVLFGVVRGVVLLGLVYLPVHIFVEGESKKEWFEGSRSAIYVEMTADFLTQFFPKFDKDPEKMFDPKDIKKVIETRDIIRDMDEKVKKGASEKDLDASTTYGQGYEDELRDKMKELLKEQAPSIQEGTEEETPSFQPPTE